MTAPPRIHSRAVGREPRDASLLFLLAGLTVVELSWLAALAYALYRLLS